MSNSFKSGFGNCGSEDVSHLEPSGLKVAGSNGKMVRLYRFVGSTSGALWDGVRDYFVYVTPEFVLRNGVTGFRDYGDIGWYCKHKDLFIVEERLDVPLYLTVGYRERLSRSEAGEWYSEMVGQREERVSRLREVKDWFTEAVYPEDVRDYVGDIVLSSRVYLPVGENFFDEGGVCWFVREEQDFIAMFVNLEFSKGLGNCRGVLDGIFCYLDFDEELADRINDLCDDETDDFRELFVHERDCYVFGHEPRCGHQHHHHHHCCHEFHSGCTRRKPWERDEPRGY